MERSRNATDMQNARAVVTAFAVDDTADRPDNFHGGAMGGAKNGDTRVDDYAWYAMKAAGEKRLRSVTDRGCF